MTLYDALFLYGLALRDAYDETKNTSVYMDGKFIWNKMTARQFMGKILFHIFLLILKDYVFCHTL